MKMCSYHAVVLKCGAFVRAYTCSRESTEPVTISLWCTIATYTNGIYMKLTKAIATEQTTSFNRNTVAIRSHTLLRQKQRWTQQSVLHEAGLPALSSEINPSPLLKTTSAIFGQYLLKWRLVPFIFAGKLGKESHVATICLIGQEPVKPEKQVSWLKNGAKS